jgi:hypothetical protein
MMTIPSTAPSAPTPSAGPVEGEVTDGVGELDTLLGVNVVTVTDRLRARSAPRVSEDSIKYEPLLPIGTFLHVFNGPVNASGYSWYEVASFSLEVMSRPPCGLDPGQPCGGPHTGWVARSGRDGELWLEPAEPDCPPVPTNPRAVHTVSLGARLGCFSEVPITFRARLISCNCDVDGGGFVPRWFGPDDQPLLLVEPSERTVPPEYDQWLIVVPDPDGEYPDVLPVGQVVEVTGMFDHPDARNCSYQGIPIETSGPPTPSSACRFMFATTSIAVVQS